jgi:outer membrane protein TolC
LGLLLTVSGVGAAEPPVLTLPQLTAMALEYSPEVKASQSQVTVAQEQKAEVQGYYYPQIDTLVTSGLAPNARLPQVRGNSIVYPDPKNRIHGFNIFGRLDFKAVQPLYTFGKIAFREDAAGKYVNVKKAEVDSKRGEVIFNVAQAYYGLVLAEQGKGAVKEARTYLSDTRSRINRLLQIKSASVAEADLYRLAAYEGALEKFAAEADEGAKVAYQALKALIGYGPGQEFTVSSELPDPKAAPAGLDYYIKTSLELRPEFTMLKEGLVARELLVKAATADLYPDFFLAVVGAISGAPGRRTLQDPYVQDYFNEHWVGPVLGMKWHWDFGITTAKIRQAQAELQGLQHQNRAALMGIPVEVAKEFGKLQENYKATVGLEKAYVNARRWLITAFSNFDMGIGKMEDIFQAFERYGAFRGDFLMTLYQYNVSVVKLDKATGAFRRTMPRETPKTSQAQ